MHCFGDSVLGWAQPLGGKVELLEGLILLTFAWGMESRSPAWGQAASTETCAPTQVLSHCKSSRGPT